MNKDNKQQIARIRTMEQRMNRAAAAVKRLSVALDKWESAQEDITALADLKRGVLSEDGLWNLLVDVRELDVLLKVTAKKKK